MEKNYNKLELPKIIYIYMIIEEYVEVKKNSNNIKYYQSLNYKVNSDGCFKIKPEDLPKNSHININVKCDICGLEKKVSYYSYRRNVDSNINKIYTCIKCSKIKSKETNLNKYGTEYPIQNSEIKKKRKENNIKKYNIDEPLKNEDIKNKIKLTKLEKYGNEKYNNIEKNKNTKIEKYGIQSYNNREKNRNTCLNKYQFTNVSMSPLIKEKKKLTYIKNYGVDNYSKSTVFKNKRIDFLKNKYNNLKVVSSHDNILMLECDCKNNHNFEIELNILRNRLIYQTILCTVCNPVNSYTNSGGEVQLQNFIKENYQEEIIFNDRSIIKPHEIDIYLPKIKLAIEYNGLYWHNEINKNKNYHLNKTEECEKLGVNLIHIYEDDWNLKRNIIKSRILNLLKKSTPIYARNCTIKEINDNKIIKEFLHENHLQGFVGSRIKIGLFYKDELVSLMTFGTNRKNMGQNHINNSYELLRFCNKNFSHVIGGASKLFKYFIKKYQPDQVISYADRSWSKGNLYEKLGFSLKHKTLPNYFYVIDNVKKYRFQFRKDKLITQGYSKDKSEHEIMLERKIFRIYDSGHLKYVYTKQKSYS